MGCGHGKTIEQEKKPSGRFPVCKLTIPTNDLEIDSICAYDENRIIIGAKGDLQLCDLTTKSFSSISKEHPNRINCIIKLKNNTIVTAGQDSSIKLWDIEKKACTGTLKGHTSFCWVINELKNNKLISGSDDKQCKVWDLKKLKEDFTLYKSHREISAVIQLKTEKILLCSGKQMLLFDLKTKNQETCMEVRNGAWVLKELNNGDVVAGQGKGIVSLIKVTDELQVKATFKNYHTRTVSLCVELDNLKIVTAGDENDLVMYDVDDMDSMFIIKGHSDAVTALTKINGGSFATVSKDKTLKVWE